MHAYFLVAGTTSSITTSIITRLCISRLLTHSQFFCSFVIHHMQSHIFPRRRHNFQHYVALSYITRSPAYFLVAGTTSSIYITSTITRLPHNFSLASNVFVALSYINASLAVPGQPYSSLLHSFGRSDSIVRTLRRATTPCENGKVEIRRDPGASRDR